MLINPTHFDNVVDSIGGREPDAPRVMQGCLRCPRIWLILVGPGFGRLGVTDPAVVGHAAPGPRTQDIFRFLAIHAVSLGFTSRLLAGKLP
jgi:hypothetical protein